MKSKHFLPLAALCLMAASCGGAKQTTEKSAGIQLANMDTTAHPGTDFYQYTCGGWVKSHPLTAEYSRFGSFDQLSETNRGRIRDIITTIAEKPQQEGSIAQKIGDLYNLAMDSVQLNKEGYEPIKAELQKLADYKDWGNLYDLIANLQKEGIVTYLYTGVGADEKNSDVNMIQITQAGLSMGNKDYYLSEEPAIVKIREGFRDYVKKMFGLIGYDEKAATHATDIVMNIETDLAKAFRSNTELRDPQANYNKMSVEDLEKMTPSFDWKDYFNTLGLKGVTEVIVGQPNSLKEAAELLKNTTAAEQSIYLQWKLINAASEYLSDDFANANFDFYGRIMSGKQQMQPRWKRAVSTVGGTLGEAVGQMYVEKYFPAEAKERMLTLVKNLQKALGERIDQLSWMSDTTKMKAHEKLNAFHVKIGYPDKWKDYSTLDVKKDSYWANIERANEWEHQDMVSKFGKPVDKDEWQMTPQTVNAYYNPTTNEICFPAGILQYPFFDMNADDAFNYGAIGVVIGHEMTHGFDDQGRQYDKDGNLKDWWTPEDAEKFQKRAQVMVNFFDSVQVAPGVHGNGKLTLGENIADNGGLKIAYQAFKDATKDHPLKTVDGLTPDQRFYIAYANVWANNIRPEEILKRTKNDPHSLGMWRVNGQVPQIETWYKAFNVTDKDPMFIPVDKRVSIW